MFNIAYVMKKRALLPRPRQALEGVGENIKLARLRRRLSMQQVSERAGLSRATLWGIEKGSPQVAMGSYAQVLFVLDLDADLLQLAKDDAFGRKLQDLGLLVKKRAPRRSKTK